MGTIQVDYQHAAQFGLTYMGADNREHSPVVIHRALLGARALHRDPDRALRRRVPVLARARPGAADPGRGGPPRRRRALAGELREAGYRVDTDDRDETVGKRIRDAELEKVPKVIVYGDQGVPRLARGPRPRWRAGHEELRGARRGACYSEPDQSRSGPVPHPASRGSARVQPRISGVTGRCLQRLSSLRRRNKRAW